MSCAPRKRISSMPFSVHPPPAEPWIRRALTVSRTALRTCRAIVSLASFIRLPPCHEPTRMCIAVNENGRAIHPWPASVQSVQPVLHLLLPWRSPDLPVEITRERPEPPRFCLVRPHLLDQPKVAV